MIIKDIIQKNICKIVIIHENFAVRQSLKFIVKENFRLNKLNAEVFTSDNVEEGLAYSMLVKPAMVILGSSIPEYDGRNVVDYFSSNKIFQENGRSVIVFSERRRMSLPENYFVVDEKDSNHIDVSFEKALSKFLGHRRTSVKVASGPRVFLSRSLLIWFSRCNLLSRSLSKSPVSVFTGLGWMLWGLGQVVRGIFLVLFLFSVNLGGDENNRQYEADIKNYRIKYFPALSLALVLVSFLLIELFAYVSGGSFVFRNSLGDGMNANRTYSLKVDGSFRDTTGGDTLAFAISDVRGADTVFHTNVDASDYETEGMYCPKPLIRSFDVGFSKIDQFAEVREEESGETEGVVLYQLSNNGIDWYYLEKSPLGGVWEMTTRGVQSASDLETVNKYIDQFDIAREGTKFYLKIMRCGVDASSVPVIDSVEIETSPVQNTPGKFKEKEVIDFSRDATKIELFDTLTVGESISVRGKILELTSLYKLVPPSKWELDDYVVKLYASHSKLKDDSYYIGNANLFVNSRGELQFNYKGAFGEGDYIIAELVKSTDEKFSLISKPFDVGVITVDSSLDFPDLKKDSVCNAGDDMCTLRAALYEFGRIDNLQIRFNIPKYDLGYRDIDRPGIAGSGNTIGGDDYWYISIENSLNIPEGVLNGSSQSISQGNTRVDGAEILLDSKYLKDWIPPEGMEVTW